MAQPQPPSLSEELGLVTGDQVPDLRALSNAAWFVFNPASVNTTAITGDPIGYVAFGKQYFGVSVDWNAVALWESAADQLDAIAAGLLTGIQGAEDVRTLDAFFDAVTTLTDYLTTRTPMFTSWVESAGITDAGLGGTAVELLVSTLDRYAKTLEGWRSSLQTASGVPLAGAIDNARVLLRQFNHDVAGSWADVQGQGLRGRVRQGIENAIAAVQSHLVGAGIVLGTPNYLFDDWDPAATLAIATQADLDAFNARVEAAIISALGAFPQGSLQSPATWAAINQAITASVAPLIEQVSAVARERRTALATGYADLTTGLAPASGLGARLAGTGAPEPPPAGQGGEGAGGEGDPGGFAGDPGGFAGDPGGAVGGANTAFALAGSPGPGAGPGGEALPPPGSGLAGRTNLDLEADFDLTLALPTDASAGSGVLPGPVIGGDAAFLALGTRSLAPAAGQNDEPDGLGESVVVPGIGTAGAPLVLPVGLRVVPAAGNPDEEEELANGAAGAAAAQAGSLAAIGGAAGAPVPSGTAGTPVPSGAAGAPLPFGNAGRPLPVGLTDPALTLSAGGPPGLDSRFGTPSLDSRIGGGGQAGLPRPVGQIMIPASPASAYQSPGFWPPGSYGPSQTQFAGSPVGYGTAGRPGPGPGRGGFGTDGDLRFRDSLRARESPSRLAALYGHELGGQPRRPAGRDDPHRTLAGDRPGRSSGLLRRPPERDGGAADEELDRGRVVPDEQDESWSPLPDGRADGVVAPVDDHETPETYASVATIGMLVGVARRRSDDDDDDDDGAYRDKPRRGLADGVVDRGE